LFFTATATSAIYTLSLHDALPILDTHGRVRQKTIGSHRLCPALTRGRPTANRLRTQPASELSHTLRMPASMPLALRQLCLYPVRSEEHTSELQSLAYLVCRLLLEK